MSLRTFGVLVVAVGVVVGVPPVSGTDGSAKNGRIVFVRPPLDGGSHFNIWTMRPNGKDLVNLTADSDAFDTNPRWQPNGRRIVFISGRATAANPAPADTQIFVMNADGSNVRQITFNALDDEAPSWSPDGRKIIFERDFDPVFMRADYDLFIMNADGTRQRNITNSPGIQDRAPAWSPNGRRIAFESDRDGDEEIYTMNPYGSHVQQLTFNGAADSGASWSPDGHKIALFSGRDGNDEIYTMRPNGSDQTRLTFDTAEDSLPDWSPDGRKIAFASDRDGNGEIYTMRVDGSSPTRLTRSPEAEYRADWQPLHKHHH